MSKLDLKFNFFIFYLSYIEHRVFRIAYLRFPFGFCCCHASDVLASYLDSKIFVTLSRFFLFGFPFLLRTLMVQQTTQFTPFLVNYWKLLHSNTKIDGSNQDILISALLFPLNVLYGPIQTERMSLYEGFPFANRLFC